MQVEIIKQWIYNTCIVDIEYVYVNSLHCEKYFMSYNEY